MKDTTIGKGHLTSITDVKSGAKQARKNAATPPTVEFQETLATAQQQMKGVEAPQKPPEDSALTATGIQEEMRNISKQLEQMMLAKEQIAKAYRMVQNTKPGDVKDEG